jgi:NitT/TauT family transport system ATP-binding protein
MVVNVDFSNVTKRFGPDDRGTLAIEDLSFSVAAGEFVSIVGPSGCGKSTLLRIAAGLVSPTSGEVLLSRSPVEVSMVFQDSRLLPWMTVEKNVSLPLRAKRSLDAARAERLAGLLELVGLEEFAAHLPHQLSGGMQQRVGIARALSTDPDLLLLDEPFGALDALTREALNLELMGVWERTRPTVLLVTHSISEAVLLSNRVIVMSARPGRVVGQFDVEFPFPRALELTASAEFGTLVARARALLYADHHPVAT